MTHNGLWEDPVENHKIGGSITQESVLIGQILREKRNELKIEIAAVSSRLKIKDRDVEGIENGDLSMVTKHLYIPGLISSYARFLKVDKKIIDEKIKLLPIKSNVENKKHQLLNIGEDLDLSPPKDACFNFLLISILLFLVLLSIYNSSEDKSDLITNQNLILELEHTES
jgi:cytoskeletal protein RodZ